MNTNNTHSTTEHMVLQILDTAGALERRMDSALSFSRGVTFSEYRLLRTLADADQGLTRVALAQRVSVTPSGVTRALKPLEKLGYVTTVKNDRDARQSLAALTQGGRALLSDVQVVLEDFYAELGMEALDKDQLQGLELVLGRLRHR